MKLSIHPLPKAVVEVSDKPHETHEKGFLYFEVSPWHRESSVYLKVRSRGTVRAIDQWLDRISNWHNVGCVTHRVAPRSTL